MRIAWYYEGGAYLMRAYGWSSQMNPRHYVNLYKVWKTAKSWSLAWPGGAQARTFRTKKAAMGYAEDLVQNEAMSVHERRR